MAKSKLVEVNKKIEEKVVGAYKSVESSVVGIYKKVEDKFVDSFLTKDGETVEDAKNRITAEQRARTESAKAEMERKKEEQNARIQANIEKSRNAGKK